MSLAMSGSDREDSITTLNTALNKSMILMDSPLEPKNKTKAGKLIKINEKIQPASPSSETPPVVLKSILKKSKSQDVSEDLDSTSVLREEQPSNPLPENEESVQNHMPRPHNLQDFLREDSIILDPTHSTFDLADLSDSEEMWIIDIPKTVDPRKLSGQKLSLGKKSKLKIGEDRYCAVNRHNVGSLTWVFNTGQKSKPYKAVNVTPTAAVTIRRKLPTTAKQVPEPSDTSAVPFPSNLKIRHPFFGPSEDIKNSLRIKMASK